VSSNNDSHDKKSDAMAHLAARVSSDPFFLGELLAAYQRRHHLDEPGLANVLGCPVAVLTSLRLCRKPGAAAPQRTAEQDIDDICRRFGVNPEALRRIVAEAHAADPQEGDPD
jgi:hypothetical protein